MAGTRQDKPNWHHSMNPQNNPTKACPRCGIGKVFTGHMSSVNAKVDGKTACPDCVVEHIKEKFMAGRGLTPP